MKGGEYGGDWQAARDGSAPVRRLPRLSLLVYARWWGRACVGDGNGRDEVGGGIGGGRDDARDARESMWCRSESGGKGLKRI